MRRLIPRAFALIVIIAGTSDAFPQSPNQSLNSDTARAQKIEGTVINSVTREPLPRALVFSPDERFATRTDAEGKFTFEVPPSTSNGPGPSQPSALRARKPGFLESGEPVSSDATNTTLALVPECVISGRVLLNTSEPADPIELELYRRDISDGRAHWVLAHSVTSRSSGAFRFADLSAGTYKLLTRELLDRDPLTFDPRGQLYGYPPVYFPNTRDFASAEAIRLTPGKSLQADISISRQGYYRVNLPVVNSASEGAMQVVVSPEGHRGPGFALSYNATDHAIEGMLPNGNYTVELSGYGEGSTSGFVNLAIKGGPAAGPALILNHGASIAVSVKEEFSSDQPPNSVGRSNLNVSLEPADDFGAEHPFSLRAPKQSGEDALVIEDVQPGHYWVRVNSPNGFAASVTSGQLDLLHQALTVSPGSGNAPIEITLRNDFAEISGTLENPNARSGTDGSKTPLASAYVYCIPLPDSSGQFRETVVSNEQPFDLAQIQPGSYHMLAFDHPQGELEYRNPEAMRVYDSKGQRVRVLGGQKEQVRLQVISTNE